MKITMQTTLGEMVTHAESVRFNTQDGISFEVGMIDRSGFWNFTDPVCGGKIMEVDGEYQPAAAIAIFRDKMRGISSAKFLQARSTILKTVADREATP